jgi:RHS repeat-associated protein
MANRVNSRLRIGACLLGLFSFATVQSISIRLKKSAFLAAVFALIFIEVAGAQTPVVSAVNDAATVAAGTIGATTVLSGNDVFPAGSVFTLQTGATCTAPVSVTTGGIATYTVPSSGICIVNYKLCAPSPNTTVCGTATLTVTATNDDDDGVLRIIEAAAKAQAEDDDNVLLPIIGKLVNETVKPTVTTSIQPSVALFSQPLWFTVTITNPAILAPMKNVAFSQSLGTRFQAYVYGTDISISPATCTGTLTVSTLTNGVANTVQLANGVVPPKTSCTYRVRLQGVNPDSSQQTNFTLAAMTVTGANVTSTTYPAGSGTPTTVALGYNTSIYPVSVSVSPPPYVIGTPVTFTATAGAAAGTLNGITFVVNGVVLEGVGTGLSRSVTIASPVGGNLGATAYASATAGAVVGQLSPYIFVNGFNAVLDVAAYSSNVATLRVSVYNNTISSNDLMLGMKIQGIANSTNFQEVIPATNPRTFTQGLYTPDAAALVTAEINVAGLKVITNTVVVSGTGGSAGGEGQNGVTPQGGNAVGAMAGAFDVTDSGAATYTIPIALPPGTAGLAPSLALSYSSQGGGGMAGVGWSLSGFSAIHRCTANQYIDNSRSALTYDANDKFCLDGQRLIKLADGTYRTERDSFSRITAIGGNAANPDYWQVESKAGLIMLYGSSEANAGANSKFVGPNSSIRAWAINKVKDRKANYYAVDYVLDTANNIAGGVIVAQRPTSLRYTGNDTTGRATFASVELVYEANLAAEQALLYGTAGAQSQSLFRLKQVITKESGSQVRTYSLTYKTSVASGRSILTFVQECGFGSGGGIGLCLTATAITAPDSTPAELAFTHDPAQNTSGIGPTDNEPVYVADLDGDGKSDFLKYGGGTDGPNGHNWLVRLTGTGTLQTWHTNHGNARVVLGDFNGDGKTDLLNHIGGADWERCLSTGTGFICTNVTLKDPSGALITPDINPGNQAGADFDGDGRTDLLLYRGRDLSTFASKWTVCLSIETGFQCSYIVDGPIQTSGLPGSPGMAAAFIGDFNGDGRADIAGYGKGDTYKSNWQIGFSNFGSSIPGFTMGPAETKAGRQWPTKAVVADFNGDGMADMLSGYNDDAARQTDWEVCFSKGDGTFTCEWWAGRVSGVEMRLLGDFNGDGRTDVAQWDAVAVKWKVCLSTGKKFECSFWGGGAVPADGDGNKFDQRQVSGDFNGDGKSDIATYDANTSNATYQRWRFLRPTGRIPDMVTQVKDGLGKEANFVYEPLTTTASYSKSIGAVFPALDIQSPMYVVTGMSTNDGIGGMRSFSYKYAGLRGHANGGGLLGFASRDVVDNLTQRTTTSTYSQDYANRIAGSPISMQVKTQAGSLLSSSTSSYQTRVLSGSSPAVYQIFPANSASSSYDPLYSTSSPFSSVSSSIALGDIDSYGNVTKSTSTSGVVKVTNSTYEIDTSSWMIGRPRTVSVTSTYGSLSLTRNSSFSYVAGTSLVSAETIEPGGGEVSVTTNHDYDDSGNRTESRVTGSGISGNAVTPGCAQPAGAGNNCRSMKYGYEANGRYANSMTNAAGHTSSVEQNTRLGVVIKTIDANGITTTSTPDYLGRNIAGYSSLGINTATTYAANDVAGLGAVMKITSTASASPPSIAYIDILGREIRRDTQGADGLYYSVSMSYDARGRKLSVTRPYLSTGNATGATSFSYENDLDRMIRETAPDGGITVIQPSGLTTTVYRAPSGEPTAGAATTQKTVRTVNDQGWTISVTDALGQTTGYSHDPHGNLLQVSKPGQTAVVMTYDIRGRKKTLVDPDAGSISYSYNSAGDLLAESVSGGRSSNTDYDALGRPLTRTATAESKTFTTTYGYDGSYAKGKLVSESSSTPLGVNARSWAFDAKSRVTSSTVNLAASPLPVRSFTTTTAYDANSRVQSITYPQNGNALNALKYTYQNGYFQSAQYNLSTIWNTTDRFPDQQVKTASLGGLTVARTYDAIGRIATTKTTNASAAVLQNATFGFDTLGNLNARSDTSAGLSENFCYDVLNRVKGSIGSCNTFNYDGAGNVTKPGAALAYTGGTNRLSSVDGLGVTYDTGGNVKSDGTRIYSYTPYDVPDRISQGNQWMEFGFTGNGQRAYERDGANATASGITYFAGPGFFEQDNTIANGVATVSEVREYLATPAGTIGVVVTNSLGSNISLYLQDHLGSNVASVNATTGVVTRSSYDVWGVRSAALDKGNRGYTGHEHLDFGLIHMNGRVYDPRWGRFLQADPVIQSPYDLQNYNRYSYVMNNPLSFTDPTGFSRWTNFRDRYGKAILAIVASVVTYGAASSAVMSAYSVTAGAATAEGITVAAMASATPIGLGSSISVATVAGAAGGAAAGFAAGGIMGGNVKSALTGAVTGAIGGGVGGYFGNSYSLERVAAESVAGGINSRIQGQSFASGFKRAAVFSLLSYGNWSMRREMIAQSRLNGANANGVSGGYMGDEFSLAGARAEYDGNNKKLPCVAPLGGCQGTPNLANGDDPKNFLGLEYSPNSVPDRINEAFAGPHDWFRNLTGSYDLIGNSRNLAGFALSVDKFMNFALLLPAAPLAIGGLIQTQAPAIIYLQGK